MLARTELSVVRRPLIDFDYWCISAACDAAQQQDWPQRSQVGVVVRNH
jgi:hypothetical protein